MNTPVEVGNRIEMVHMASAEGFALSETKYGSKLLDYDGIRSAKIAVPTNEGHLVAMTAGDDYQLCFFTNAGLFQCKARIRKRLVENKIHMLEVLFLTKLEKYQRRKYYRLECSFDMKYRVLTESEKIVRQRLEENNFPSYAARRTCEEAVQNAPLIWRGGTVSDLSGGGIRFRCRRELVKENWLEVTVPLSFARGIVPVCVLVRVVACTYFEANRDVYEVRGEFEYLSDDERELVIQYVFEEQRRRMRKEQ